MSLRGADIEQLVTLNRTFVEKGGEVEALSSQITSVLSSTNWTGPGADQFREQWNGEFVPALNRLRESLAQAGQAVESRRQAIETATA